MTHSYQIDGMTCSNCIDTIKKQLESIPGIKSATIQLQTPQATLVMDQHVSTEVLQNALKSYPKYQIKEYNAPVPVIQVEEETENRPFWNIYKPIILVFAYILGVSVLVEVAAGAFDWMRWMRHFMAAFFLVFSFFKLLDIPSFAMSYSSYDVVAKRWLGWGYIYPFVELALGIMFLLNFEMWITNLLTLVVMGISSIGVFQSLLANRKIKCACLGADFNLPMSTVTLIEDLLMAMMAAVMLIAYL